MNEIQSLPQFPDLTTLLSRTDTEERCGFILTDGVCVEIENVAEDKEAGYVMEPQAAMALVKTGEVIGTWHTHPNAAPDLSGDDYKGFLSWPDMKHLIIGIEDADIATRWYEITSGVVVVCD